MKTPVALSFGRFRKTFIMLFFFNVVAIYSLFAQSDNASITCGSYLKIHSIVMGEDRTLLIRLPEDYSKSDKTYPVPMPDHL